MKSESQINDKIKHRTVRVIGSDGSQRGIMDTVKALVLAEEEGMDLVLMSDTTVPPVCKIMNYGKHLYEMKKKQREADKKTKKVEVKEVRLRPSTDVHDLEIKAKSARKFLSDGDKVKVTIRLKGRELAHPDLAHKALDKFKGMLKDVSKVDDPAEVFSGRISITLLPL